MRITGVTVTPAGNKTMEALVRPGGRSGGDKGRRFRGFLIRSKALVKFGQGYVASLWRGAGERAPIRMSGVRLEEDERSTHLHALRGAVPLVGRGNDITRSPASPALTECRVAHNRCRRAGLPAVLTALWQGIPAQGSLCRVSLRISEFNSS
jgi:hypothetical protein